MSNGNGNGRRHVDMDPAVAAVLGDGQRRTRMRTMTRAQRRRAKQDAQRQRIMLELDPAVVTCLRTVAQIEGMSPAGAANLLLFDALGRYAEGELVETFRLCRPSRGPRYEWVAEIPQERMDALSRRIGDIDAER